MRVLLLKPLPLARVACTKGLGDRVESIFISVFGDALYLDLRLYNLTISK